MSHKQTMIVSANKTITGKTVQLARWFSWSIRFERVSREVCSQRTSEKCNVCSGCWNIDGTKWTWNSLGHAGGLMQFLVCSSSPSQSSPPFAGEGLVHVLERVWVPPPHVLEHVDHSDHSVNPPSTERFSKKKSELDDEEQKDLT